MTRGDARLLFTIICSASIAAIVTGLVMRMVATASNDQRVVELSHRVSELETRPAPVVIAPPVIEAAPAPVPVIADEPVADPNTCDEVSCVLNDYQPACCAPFNKRTHANLDRRLISDGMAAVKPTIVLCGDHSPVKGRVKISVKVAPAGTVSSVTVRETPDAALGRCVAAAMQHATFAKTEYGGSFAYPFMF